MKAFFVRKLNNLEELKDFTERALGKTRNWDPYTVIKEINLSDEEFKAFSEDFFNDQDWLTTKDGGRGIDGKLRCIRVINRQTGEAVLVNNEGYSYARYTALEN